MHHGPGCITETDYTWEEYDTNPWLRDPLIYKCGLHATTADAAKIIAGFPHILLNAESCLKMLDTYERRIEAG